MTVRYIFILIVWCFRCQGWETVYYLWNPYSVALRHRPPDPGPLPPRQPEVLEPQASITSSEDRLELWVGLFSVRNILQVFWSCVLRENYLKQRWSCSTS